MHRHGLDTVFLAAPTSTPRRIKLVAQYSTGFVYLVSRTGVTGEQDSLSASVAPLVEAVRAATDLPLAVGFGISKPAHVAELGRLVEAVVVGSAIRPPDRTECGESRAGNPNSKISPANSRAASEHGMTPEEAQAQLEQYRLLIDDVDRRIVALLNERTARSGEHRPRQTRGQTSRLRT